LKQKSKYNGYKSFQYLEPGVDYKVFKLAKEIGRVPSYTVPVTPEQEQIVQEILATNIVVSAHEHIYITTDDISQIFEYKHSGRNWTPYELLSKSGIDVVFENFMNGSAVITSHSGWKWTDIIHDLGMRFSDFAHQEMLFKAETYDDLLQAKPEGKIAVVASLEAATQIENEVDRVDVLYGFGVRCMGITYSESNALGSGLKEARDGGLTKFGQKVVSRMNKLRDDHRRLSLRRQDQPGHNRVQRKTDIDKPRRCQGPLEHKPSEARRSPEGMRREGRSDRD
jgi:membrane dipeptidase